MSWNVDSPKYYSSPQSLLLWQLGNCRMSMFWQPNKAICQEFRKPQISLFRISIDTRVCAAFRCWTPVYTLGPNKVVFPLMEKCLRISDRPVFPCHHLLLISLGDKCIRAEHRLTAGVVGLWDRVILHRHLTVRLIFLWIFHTQTWFYICHLQYLQY